MTDERFETRFQNLARGFPYPPTPDLADRLRARIEAGAAPASPRRLAWALAALAFALVALTLAVPPARATVFEVLRLGAVRVLLGPLTSTPTATAPPVAPGIVPSPPSPAVRPPATDTPPPSPTPYGSLLEALAGETTLEAARAAVEFPIPLPSYPADLGPPDRVFLQDLGGPLVVLVWLDPQDPGRVRLSLHLLGPGVVAEKAGPRVVRETTVGGQRALWTEGPYLVRLHGGGYVADRLVEGHVLIWTEGEVTYRLETDLPLEAAVRIVESLQP